MLISPPMPWHPRVNPIALKRENDRLSFALVRTREALEISERRRTGLEIVLSARLTQIGELNARVERLSEQNKQLDAECERLVEMIKFASPVDTAAPTPK